MKLPAPRTEARILVIMLIPFLLLLLVFGYMGFCSFPISDDFIMAQDLSKGFFWAVQYWLGYWLSSWTTAAAELCIPLAFGFYDYGLVFFLFVACSLFFSSLLLFRTFLANRQQALAASFLFFTVYLIFVPSVSEVVYWNIGALAYTIPFAGFLSFIAFHEKARIHVQNTSAGPETKYLIALGITAAAGLFYIWKVVRVGRFIVILDGIFPPDYVYLYWAFLLFLTGAVYFLSSRFYFLNHVLMAVLAFLVVGLSPQTAIFLLSYAGIYLAFDLYKRRSWKTFSLFVFLAVAACFFIMMKMPGTAGRMSLTNPHIKKDLHFYLLANLNLIKVHFLTNFTGAGYLLTFFTGLILRSGFDGRGQTFRKELPWLFLMSVLALHVVSVLLFHFSNGHFPLRLSCSFIALNYLLFFAAGITMPLAKRQEGILREKAVPAAFLAMVLLLAISPNPARAISEIWSGEAGRFRAYKLDQYQRIQNCKSDTCTVPYQSFALQTIQNQEFVFPGDKGFLLSHKFFVSRYFKKELIRYDVRTLPPEKVPSVHPK